MKLAHYVINKLTPHGMSKIQKFSPKFMLTQQTFDTCMFQFPFRFQMQNKPHIPPCDIYQRIITIHY